MTDFVKRVRVADLPVDLREEITNEFGAAGEVEIVIRRPVESAGLTVHSLNDAWGAESAANRARWASLLRSIKPASGAQDPAPAEVMLREMREADPTDAGST